MKIDTAIGYIFKPEKPESRIYSVRLEISESKITLEVPKESIGIEKYDILLGVFNGFGNVTFIDCNLCGSESGGGGHISKFEVLYLLKGVHIYSSDKLFFSKSTIDFPALVNWLDIRPITNNLGTKKTLSVNLPDDIEFASFEKFKLSFSFRYFYRSEISQIFIKQSTCLKIESINGKLSLLDFIEKINHFKKFLLIYTNQSSFAEEITFYSNDYCYDCEDNESTELIPIDLITNWGEIKKEVTTYSPTVDYKLIKEDFKNIIHKWYDNKDLSVSIDLILEKFFNSKLSRENYFLNSCFAIETFHRRFRNIDVYSKSEFKKIRDDILSKIENPEIYEFIKEKLSFSNEPTFRARLFDLKDNFEKLLPESVETDEYIIKIVKTRNYLVHRGSNKNTFEGLELFYVAKYIESIVRINVFKVLGTPEEVISKSVACTKRDLIEMYLLNKRLQTSVPNIL